MRFANEGVPFEALPRRGLVGQSCPQRDKETKVKYILKTLLGAGSRSRLTKGQTTAISDEFMTKVAEATNEAMDAGMPADIAARKLLYVVAGLAQGGMSSGRITIVNTATAKEL